MKINLNKKIWTAVLIFVVAFALRLYQLSFFEYKNDQYFAISLGNDTRAAHFLVTHGMNSGTGLENPPFFPYLMGLITFFTHDPAQVTFCFFCMNLLALGLGLIYFYRTLPYPYAILSTAFLGLFPAFTIYSNNIWAQCTLPLLMILFHICLYRFVLSGLWKNFLYMGLLAALAAQFHGSGFLLFPLLVVIAIAYRKKINAPFLGLTILSIVVLFIPYFIHLFSGRELGDVLRYGTSGKRGFPWKILPYHYRMASFEFFRNYFKLDFNTILKIIAGNGRFILYPLTFIPGVLFVSGFGYYLKWLLRGKLFDTSESALKEYPLPFQISGLMVLALTLEYLMLRVVTAPHYCIVLFPAYSVLTAFVAFKIWRFLWGRIIVAAGILSTFALLVGVLLFLDRAGGHPYEYGVSYKTLVSWQKEITAMKRPGECFDLKVRIIGKDSTPTASALSVLNENTQCRPDDKIVPMQINIEWNSQRMRYEKTLET